jgi:sulfonate transport system substrate-binding protein
VPLHDPSSSSRRMLLFGLGAGLVLGPCAARAAADALPSIVPPGTTLIVGDQNEVTQALLIASGEQARLGARVSYANFLGGPAILEAFHGGALDLAMVGSAPPAQAQAAGEHILIVAGARFTQPDYKFAFRPGLAISRLEDFRGKRITYGKGTGRQPFLLAALKAAGLTRKDVTLVSMQVADFPSAIRSGGVDIAVLNEPHYSRYVVEFAGKGVAALPASELDRLPRGLSYLYASAQALVDPAKTAAIRDYVLHWMTAYRWSKANPDPWIDAYYVRREHFTHADGQATEAALGNVEFPPLRELVTQQQQIADLIYEAGDFPRRLDARAEFDLRFDQVIAPDAPAKF